MTAAELAHAAASTPLSDQLALLGLIVQVVGVLLTAVGVAVAVGAARRGAPVQDVRSTPVAPIDELRDTIEQRLREVLEETERLRAALAALGDAAPAPASAPRRRAPRNTSREVSTPRPRRAPRGSVRQAVLHALSDGEARTPTEVAALTGQNRATVASTLTRLLAEGALNKPERGYQLPGPPPAADPGAPSPGDRALQALRSELGAGLRTRGGA